MTLPLPRLAAAASFVFAAPLLAGAAFASEPAQESTETPAAVTAQMPVEAETAPAPVTPETPASTAPAAEPEAVEEPEEEARICRKIRLDASSRRKSRVCLTQQGWRDLNNRR